jgi:hypothetical protein
MILWMTAIVAFADRPTEGGLFAFDETDEIAFYEEGAIRVHYSVEGLN